MEQVSDRGLEFIKRHEGFVANTYADPVGIPTIGYGFTNGSGAVKRRLGAVKFGMRITRAEADVILREVVNTEYGPAAERGMPGAIQHEFDMGCSGCFNVGARIFKWKWAAAFRAGNKALAAQRWQVTATTARGIKLPGLVRRRREEADLLLHGNYGDGGMPSFENREPAKPVPELDERGEPVPIPEPTPDPNEKGDPVLREYQMKLKELGFDPGAFDGIMGPQTEKAVRAFQEKDPHLIDDGILGRATMESIDRQLRDDQTKRRFNWTWLTGLLGTIGAWFTEPNIITYVIIGVVLVVGGYLVWRNRARIEAKFQEWLS